MELPFRGVNALARRLHDFLGQATPQSATHEHGAGGLPAFGVGRRGALVNGGADRGSPARVVRRKLRTPLGIPEGLRFVSAILTPRSIG